MEALEHSPNPNTSPSDKAITHVHQILLYFKDHFGQTLDLKIPGHFIKLATIADLQSWEQETVKREGRLQYNRYDIAFLCVQEILKSETPSMLFPDQQRQFIDALFPRLYSQARQEYPRMIAELQELAKTCNEHALNQELHRIRESVDDIVRARDLAIKESREIYNRSFVDAFHNPLLGYESPLYYDMIEDKSPDSIVGVLTLLNKRFSRRSV